MPSADTRTIAARPPADAPGHVRRRRLRAPSAGPTAAGSSAAQPAAQVAAPARAAGAGLGPDHPLDHHHVPGPPGRGRARRAAAAPRPAPRRRRTSTRSWAARAQRGGDLLVVAGRRARARPSTSRKASHSVGSSSRRAQPGPLGLGQAAEPLDERRVLGAGEELQLAELHRLEAAGRARAAAGTRRKSCGVIVSSTSTCWTSTRSITCTRLQQVLGPPQAAAAVAAAIASRAAVDLVQQLLEPQLVDLVDGDEQQLVVGRRVGLQVLRRRAAAAAAGSCRRSAGRPARRRARSVSPHWADHRIAGRRAGPVMVHAARRRAMMSAMKFRHELTYDAGPDRGLRDARRPGVPRGRVRGPGRDLRRRRGSSAREPASRDRRPEAARPTSLPSFAKKFAGDTTRAVQREEWEDRPAPR